jgi:transposase-like protein
MEEQAMKYTKEDKVAFLEKAKNYVERGAGSYASYTRECGISRSSFYKWMRSYGCCDGDDDKSEPNRVLVNLGKPLPLPSREQQFVVNYYGSRIEVSSTNDLVILLKGIK